MQRCVRMLLLFLLALPLATTRAQDANLLRDGGFEGSYTSRGRADLNIPTDWNIWVGDTPHTEDWMNLPPVAYPTTDPIPPRTAARTP